MPAARLERTIFRISGDGALAWLEGLITNSLKSPLTFAALLTPQGKIIADFFIWQSDALYLETPAKFGEILFKRLKMYRLRAPIDIEDVSAEIAVYALWDEALPNGTPDPRHASAARLCVLADKSLSLDVTSPADWNSKRLSLNLPDSEWDFGSAETFPANANMDKLNGIDFKKGCYVGQEVVSRMHRKTEVRKRMCAFVGDSEIQEGVLRLGDRTVGDVMHTHGQYGMAMVRFDRLPEGHEAVMIGETEIRLLS